MLAGGTRTLEGYASNKVTDISLLLPFTFCYRMYYLTDPSNRSFGGDAEEKQGRIFGYGDEIKSVPSITSDTQSPNEVHSAVSPADSGNQPEIRRNLRNRRQSNSAAQVNRNLLRSCSSNSDTVFFDERRIF